MQIVLVLFVQVSRFCLSNVCFHPDTIMLVMPHISKSLKLLHFQLNLLTKLYLNRVILLTGCYNPDERREELIKMFLLVTHSNFYEQQRVFTDFLRSAFHNSGYIEATTLPSVCWKLYLQPETRTAGTNQCSI